MSTSTNPDEIPKEALELEPDAGEMNKEVSGVISCAVSEWGEGWRVGRGVGI